MNIGRVRWDDLSMMEKAAYMGVKVSEGIMDLDAIHDAYADEYGHVYGEGGSNGNPSKPPYSEWVKGVRREFMDPDYDLERAYNELPFDKMEAWRRDPVNNHLYDMYKKLGHITFSNESVYSQGPSIGGEWDERTGMFKPSETNRRMHPEVYGDRSKTYYNEDGDIYPRRLSITEQAIVDNAMSNRPFVANEPIDIKNNTAEIIFKYGGQIETPFFMRREM